MDAVRRATRTLSAKRCRARRPAGGGKTVALRYAIYYVPDPGTALAARGSALLGRNSETGESADRPLLPGIAPERLAALTAEAARYGLHATLKAPFFLKEGVAEQDLLDAAARFVLGRPPVLLHRLVLGRVRSFFTLLPAAESPAERQALHRLNALAADAARYFDAFRAPLSATEIARRNPENLTPRQRDMLVRWGYPHVFEEYRFHITLTAGARDEDEAAAVCAGLKGYLGPVLSEPVRIAGICVCRQDPDGGDIGRGAFTLVRRL